MVLENEHLVYKENFYQKAHHFCYIIITSELFITFFTYHNKQSWTQKLQKGNIFSVTPIPGQWKNHMSALQNIISNFHWYSQ